TLSRSPRVVGSSSVSGTSALPDAAGGDGAGAVADRAVSGDGAQVPAQVTAADGDGDGGEAIAGRADTRRGRGVLGHDGGSFRLRLEGTAPGGGVLGGLCATRRPVSERGVSPGDHGPWPRTWPRRRRRGHRSAAAPAARRGGRRRPTQPAAAKRRCRAAAGGVRR